MLNTVPIAYIKPVGRSVIVVTYDHTKMSFFKFQNNNNRELYY